MIVKKNINIKNENNFNSNNHLYNFPKIRKILIFNFLLKKIKFFYSFLYLDFIK